MKRPIKNSLVLISLIIVGIVHLFTQASVAQTYTALHSFMGATNDGYYPLGGMVLTNNVLYGTTYEGGLYNKGTVFSIDTDGSNFEVIHSFDLTNGEEPESPMVLVGNRLYGITYWGGANPDNAGGVLYGLNLDGSNFKNLFNFESTNLSDAGGLYAFAPNLIYYNGLLYGVLGGDSTNNYTGAVFSINTNGSNFTILHQFQLSTAGSNGISPNSLTIENDTIYGITSGPFGADETIFSISISGTNFKTLYNFATNNLAPSDNYGLSPNFVTFANGQLWGTLEGDEDYGDSLSSGAIFSMDTNGNNFFLNVIFDAEETSGLDNGAWPQAGMFLADGALWGITRYGGTNDAGAIYALPFSDGATNTIDVYDFPANSTNGANPAALPILCSNTIYGEAPNNAGLSPGFIYRIDFSVLPTTIPVLSIALATNNQVVLTWQTNYPTYSLQSTTNLNPPVTWDFVSTPPVIISNLFAVTDNISTNWIITYVPPGGSTNGPTPPGSGGTVGTNGFYFSQTSTFYRLISTNSY